MNPCNQCKAPATFGSELLFRRIHLILCRRIIHISATIFEVCHSNHASFSEIRDLLLFLRAKNVYLNVVSPERAEEMKALHTKS